MIMKRYTWFILVAVLVSMCTDGCAGYRVLVAFPFPSHSHCILGDGVVRALLAAGHQVTYMTAFPWEHPPERLRQLDISFAATALWSGKPLHLQDKMDNKIGFDSPTDFIELVRRVSSTILADAAVLEFLGDPRNQFDVVLVEWIFTDIFSALSVVFNCPYVWVSSVEPHWAVLRLVHEPTNPAYTPNTISSALPPFSFGQRVHELWNQITTYLYMEMISSRADEATFQSVFGSIAARRGRPLPPYELVLHNASLMLGNSHVSLGQATALPQSYKPIGGYHVDPDVKPLPQELKSLMDNAKNGVIYFSMGSNLKSKDFPENLKRSLLNVFGQLKQTVIWKFEDVLEDLPHNVHILKWAPQLSILSHPNCVLFITHGGLLSTTEAVHFGVPLVGIPVFADQFNNVDRAVGRGLARRVDLSYTMGDELKAAIEDITTNPKYGDRAKELSSVYHDRLVPPRQELVFWVEHVVRTRGAPHLRSPALLVPWYQKAYLDLLALLLLAIFVIHAVANQLLRKKYVFRNQKKTN